MNNIQILGNITRDIELKYTNSGTAVASFGIAHNESKKQQDGTYKDVPHFFDVTAWGKTAENINKFFRKGSRILIAGRLNFSSWEKDGAKRSKVDIVLEGFDFIDRKDSNNQSQQHQDGQNTSHPNPSYQQAQNNGYGQPQQQGTPPTIAISDSDIPF